MLCHVSMRNLLSIDFLSFLRIHLSNLCTKEVRVGGICFLLLLILWNLFVVTCWKSSRVYYLPIKCCFAKNEMMVLFMSEVWWWDVGCQLLFAEPLCPDLLFHPNTLKHKMQNKQSTHMQSYSQTASLSVDFPFLCLTHQASAVLHIFFSTLQDKVSWRPAINRTWCPDDAKTTGHQTHRKEPTEYNALWPCTIHGRLFHLKHGVPVLHMHLSACPVFCINPRLEFGGKTIEGLLQDCKNNGIPDHQNCISTEPRSWWGLEQSIFWDFNQSMTS